MIDQFLYLLTIELFLPITNSYFALFEDNLQLQILILPAAHLYGINSESWKGKYITSLNGNAFLLSL